MEIKEKDRYKESSKQKEIDNQRPNNNKHT